VQQHDQRALDRARLGDVHPQAADVELTMRDTGRPAAIRHNGRILATGPTQLAAGMPAEPASERTAAALFSRRADGASSFGERRSPGRQRA
jgi:hypothetical protein